MQRPSRSKNWLVVILLIILAGVTIWAVSILIRTTRTEKTTTEANLDYSTSTSGEKPTLIVGGDDSNPPYSYIQNGQALGYDNDLMREIAKILDMNVEFHLSSLADAKEALRQGSIDVIGGIASSERPESGMLYGTPHAILYYDLFVRRDSGIQSLSKMSDQTLIVQQGDVMQTSLEDLGYTGKVVLASNPLEALTWVASGKYDGALITKIQGYYLIKQYHLSNLKAVGADLEEMDYSYSVASYNWNLYLKINQAFVILKASGTYDDLTDKWLGNYQQSSFLDKNQYFIYGIVILLTLIFIALLWAWSLGRLVKRRTSELKASEAKYQQLINSATEGVVILVDKNIVYFNPQATYICGFKAEPPPPNAIRSDAKIFDYIHPLDQELVLVRYHQLIDEIPVNAQLVFRILTIDGDTKWIRSNSVKIDWDGKPALLSFFTDITEEQKLEEAIKTSEERYRLVFNQSPVGLFYYDTELCITNVNDRFAEIMQIPSIQLHDFNFNSMDDPRIIDVLKSVFSHDNGYFEGRIKPLLSSDKTELYVKLRTAPLLNEKMECQGGIGLLEDITAQIQNEHKLQSLEDIFSKAFYTSPDAIVISKLKTGVFLNINRGFTDLTGFTQDEIIGKSSADVDLWAVTEERDRFVKGLLVHGEYKNLEGHFRCKNGDIHTGLMSASLIEIDGEACILAIIRDINDLKKTNELIQASELRYRSIFEAVPVSIWEQDLIEIYDMLENLRSSGVTDLPKYLEEHPEFVAAAVKSVKFIDVNEASLKIYKAQNKEQLNVSLEKIFNDDSLTNFKKELISIWNHETYFSGDSTNLDLEGNSILVNVIMQLPQTREGFKSVLVSISDITQRKLAEAALLESESRYRQLVEQINVVVYLDYAVVPSRPKYISPQVETLLGYTQEEWMADPNLMMSIIHPDDRPALIEEDIRTDKTKEPFVVEYRAFTRDGRMIWIHDEAVLVCDADGNPDDWHGVMYDITRRKNAESALRESENRYRTIFNSVPVSIKEEDFTTVFSMLDEVRAAGVEDFEEYLNQHPEWVKRAVDSIQITEVNQETLRIYKAESKDQLIGPLNSFFTEESYSIFHKELLAFWNRQSFYEQETVNTTLTGEKIDVWVSIAVPTKSEDYSKILVTIMDITERKRAEEQIRVQIRYLAALRAVDMAISASMDLPITMRVLLNQVHQQLLPDAVSVLILDPHTQTLRYLAGIGFRTNAIESVNLRLGQSYAGQAALERRMVTADDLGTKSSLIHSKDFDQDQFTHYLGVPLVSKGTIKGVLELFNRGPFNQDSAWMGLLESMAGQAAIAIENATLMDEVQKVNLNLRSAYDATIEGWARSIDIRNGDSEYHAKRVADLTVELAQAAGYQGEGLLSLRRGALLHDIGKLAIPDAILLKPGPLTDQEWKIMKTHPEVARRLLNSIDLLQSAIDIPYAHHERWDGKGYPEGLEGPQIPFAARVFAVVDCWESLRSDRPWRKAWTDDNAWEYIESNSGKAFDPQIVERFRQLLGHGFAAFF